jgi:hypothetical protein
LSSRLLLHGVLDDLHTLTTRAVQKVAKDLREENGVISGYSDEGRPRGEVIRKIDESGVKAETVVDRALGRLRPRPNAGELTRKLLRMGRWVAPITGVLLILSLMLSGSGSTRPPGLITFLTFPVAYEPPLAPSLAPLAWAEELISPPKAASSAPRPGHSKLPNKGNYKKVEKEK